MASFLIPCPKISALSSGLSSKSKQNHQGCQSSISFLSDLKSNPALVGGSSRDHSAFRLSQGPKQTHFDAFKVCAQLNDVCYIRERVSIGKLSNSVPVPDKKLEEPTEKSASNNIPDAASISAFMTHVADLVELVDSRDIMELQLKQLDCELLIRKKEALPQPPTSAPVYMMQPPSSPAMFPSPLPPVQPAAPATASSVPAPPVSAPPSPAKPKSNHPPLKCPMAGTFYRSPAPGTPPFVKAGDKVQKGQVVCIIEAMKLMNEIEADHSGTLVEILVDDGKPVSVDMPLFIIEP